MKTIAISGSPRENVGKSDAKALRYEGNAPAVLYGGSTQKHFSVNVADMRDLIFTPEVHFVELNLEGSSHKAIIKEMQFHPLTDKLLHVDFLELFDDKAIVMEIPVKLKGTSPGVKMGGKLVQKKRKLRVRALPADMPQNVEVSIEKLEVGGNIRVRNVQVNNYAIINAQDDTIVSVVMSRALKQAEQEAAKSGKK